MRLYKSRPSRIRDGAAGAPRSRTRERERGIAIVELALVMPFLLLLIVGIIDFGSFFNDAISIRQGARDGGRQAAVGRFGSDTSCSPDGVSTPVGAVQLICLTKSRDNVPDDETRVRIIVGDGSTTTAYAVGNPITICEQYKMRSLTGVLDRVFGGKVFTTRTVFRIDTVSGTSPVTENGSGISMVSENAFPEEAWSCSPP